MILNDLIRFSKISVRHKPEVTWPKSALYKLHYYKPHHYHNQHNQNPLIYTNHLFQKLVFANSLVKIWFEKNCYWSFSLAIVYPKFVIHSEG